MALVWQRCDELRVLTIIEKGCVEVLFNSYEFIFLFLPITIIGFFLVSKKRRQYGTLWLVLASFFFYGWWDYHYVPLLAASICFNYWVGKHLEALAAGYEIPKGGAVTKDMPQAAARKGWLIFGIVVNVALLGYFKYTDFFLGTVNAVAGTDWFDLPHIVLPLGISFFTFTQTAYLVDAYRGQAKNQSFLTYCEFVTIFPHLIAGPIINHKEMIPQFVAEKTFRVDWHNVSVGLAILIMGLFKKVAIADKLSPWVGGVFSHADSLTFIEAWFGVLAYTLQLYFDFSGYSEMAIGLGLMINLRLPQNFDSPYQSRSIIDFWRRWHMTLGLWVKNYLYIPMGGNRHGQLKKMRNLFVSMLIIGLWHGAGWTYVFWGAWHGVMLMVNHLWRSLHINLPQALCWLMTITGVIIGWVFFRAASFGEAQSILYAMTDFQSIVLPAFCEKALGFLSAFGVTFSAAHVVSTKQFLEVVALFVVVVFIPNPLRVVQQYFKENNKWLLVLTALLVYALLKLNSYSEFLYFQF